MLLWPCISMVRPTPILPIPLLLPPMPCWLVKLWDLEPACWALFIRLSKMAKKQDSFVRNGVLNILHARCLSLFLDIAMYITTKELSEHLPIYTGLVDSGKLIVDN